MESAFEASALAARSLSVAPGSQLELYALYKQAREGDCAVGKPALWDPTGRAKWTAWAEKSGLAQEAAMEAYVDLVRDLSGGSCSSSTGAKDTTNDGGGGGGSGGFGAAKAVSTLQHADGADLPTWTASEALLAAGESGELEALDAALRAPDVDLSRRDDEGRTALHFAADRGHARACRRLLDAGAPVDARDTIGLTPLAYAVVCDHAEAAEVLVVAGADVNAADEDGETPLSSATGDTKKAILLRVGKTATTTTTTTDRGGLTDVALSTGRRILDVTTHHQLERTPPEKGGIS